MRPMRRVGLAMLLLYGSVTAVGANAGLQTRQRVLPRDEARVDPELAALQSQILRSVKGRDAEILKGVLGARVQIDFEPQISREQFLDSLASWSPDHRDRFWRDVYDAIVLGMAYVEQDVFAPYTVAGLREASGEWRDEVGVIAGQAVATRKAPHAGSPIVERLTYEVVELVPGPIEAAGSMTIGEFKYGWQQIVTPSGQNGWVSEKFIRTPYSMRLWFKRVDGSWRLVGFITGD